jgi:Fe-S cluster assembly ATPase SufC
MAKSFPNIDKSLRHGEYVGYSDGKMWRITKIGPNGSKYKWLAAVIGGECFYKATLGEISEKLARLDSAATIANC